MNVFTELSDGDVANIITYVRDEYKKMQAAPAAGAGAAGGAAADSTPSNTMIFGLLGVIIVAFIVILVLNRAIGTLERVLLKRKDLPADEQEALAAEEQKTGVLLYPGRYYRFCKLELGRYVEH
jgi:hypothetical protein